MPSSASLPESTSGESFASCCELLVVTLSEEFPGHYCTLDEVSSTASEAARSLCAEFAVTLCAACWSSVPLCNDSLKSTIPSLNSRWPSVPHAELSRTGLFADRRLIGDLSPCERRLPEPSSANTGRHPGGSPVKSAEPQKVQTMRSGSQLFHCCYAVVNIVGCTSRSVFAYVWQEIWCKEVNAC